MNQQVQSARDAANYGENNKALKILQQALAVNPNDVEAWLLLATVVEQPERKRQCLRRALTLDPINKNARTQLLELDRAAMGASFARPASPPNTDLTSAAAANAKLEAMLDRLSKAPAERLLIFLQVSLPVKVLYLFLMLFCSASFLLGKDSTNNPIDLLLALMLGLVALSATSMIEVKETAIHVSTLFKRAQIPWNEIASLKSRKRKLEFILNEGRSIKISTKLQDYSAVMEILRKKRPDLLEEPSPTQANPSAAAFTGAKTFKKSFFRQYGFTFGGVLFCLVLTQLAADLTTSRSVHWDVITIVVFLLMISIGILMIVAPFFSVSAITIEANKLTIKKISEETEVIASEIKEIKMGSIEGRRGRVTNFVSIWLLDGRHYSVTGFTDGEEIIYDFLMSWWNTCKKK